MQSICADVCAEVSGDLHPNFSHFPFSKKGDHRITKNNRGITLTAKVHNALLLKPKSRKYLGKIRTAFKGIALQSHRVWQSVKLSKKYEQRIIRQHSHLQISPRHSIQYGGKMEQILFAYGLPKEIVTAIMMLYKYMKAIICSPARLLQHCHENPVRR